VSFRKIIAAYCNNYNKRTNKLYTENNKSFNTEAVGKNIYQCLLKPQTIKKSVYVGVPKRNRKRSLMGGSVVVHASAARCLLQGPFCISLHNGSVEHTSFSMVRLFMARYTQGKQTYSRIVLEVAHVLRDKGYCLYLDNLYTSPKLDNLCTRKTDVGTMRTNMEVFPDFVKRARLKKGETVVAFRKKQVIM